MKSATCLHPKSPLRKRGVERARLKFKNYFPAPELDMDFTLKKLEYLYISIIILIINQLYISNSWGTNSLKMNVVTTPTSTPHSNRV